jgi:low temperature requirement protein LtrA
MAATDTTEQRIEEQELEAEHEEHAIPLELFFDLVFVFAFTQVTGLLSDNPTWEGLGQGMLVLAAVWWAWGAYAWLTNEIASDEDDARLALFVSMGAMLIAALAVPGAFGDDALLFGVAYFVVRALHILVFAYASPDVSVTLAVRRLARTGIPAPALLVVAGAFDGAAQALVWCLALTVDYGGPLVFGVAGYQVSAGHFAERYGLIVIIALGESIVAIGVGAAGIPLDAAVVVAALAGIAIAAALWWAYFDTAAPLAARALRASRGDARARLARDSYSYLHLPMIAGIVLVALGVKKTIGDVGEPLETAPAVALFGGVALYYAGHIGFRWRITHSLYHGRLVGLAVAIALIPVAAEVDALIALGMAAALTAAVIAYEVLRYRDARRQIRHAHAGGG